MTTDEIKLRIVNNYLYLIINETSDSQGLYVAKIVGMLDKYRPSKHYLI